MRINNIRLGFATNSSSSHSIVILPKNEQPPHSIDWFDDGQYGWGYFVLSDTQDKMAYLGTMVGSALNDLYGEEIAKAVMAEWFAGLQWQTDWFVDHQSHIEMPLDAMTGKLSKAFIEDFQRFMQRPEVHVLGGNDNDSRESFDAYHQYSIELDALHENKRHIARKSFQWWTLFNPDTGAKLRFSFEDNPPELTRSTAPELIDLKITDYCPFGCSFCYQDSTTAGKHATLEDVRHYLGMARESGVFEVAIGGGEPTLHPDFIAILKYAREIGIVPNFTTKIMPDKWSTELRQAIEQYAGSFAVSVTEAADVLKIEAYRTLYRADVRPVIHYVMGVHSSWHLERVIKACNEAWLPLTLLGYKAVGRGKDTPQKHEGITPEILRDSRRLSVDTAFLEQYGEVLDRAGVEDVLRVPGEGKFSMYIDAVNHQAGKSSYHIDELFEFEASWYGDLSEAWNKIG